ncbi:MAG: hypothetical protein RL669_786 [Pseudomonadota bacterium]|jgi:hypothetical protein
MRPWRERRLGDFNEQSGPVEVGTSQGGDPARREA